MAQLTKTQLSQLVAQGRCDESFTWQETPTSPLVTFNVTKMRQAAISSKKQPVTMELPPDFLSWLSNSRDIDMDRVQDATLDVEDPALVVDYGDSMLLIDGAHRAVRRVTVLHLNTLVAYVFAESEAIMADSKEDIVLHDLWGDSRFFDRLREE
ncbi:hypothetical protein [Ralstonia phage phiRSL1]|uniref:Uncharacterized protein n=1 Tax=Ralstonia phage phiRSL1 TaxID=1980924 RepID=B2ZXR4_9CAUD|nr:hypothetical protein RSL1_ORF049 [Ralstonia phage phiRSL1]BAG41495.1 hypothetical protein [Ralstonia phage phiRSL1]